MNLAYVRKLAGTARRLLRGNPDRFLGRVSGVIHVGANTGQERDAYERLGLKVIWVEPIPEVFEELSRNLKAFPRQRAVQCLLADRDGMEVELHVANNGGASSSILELKLHKDIWPAVSYTGSIAMRSTTLDTMLAREGVDASEFGALVLDTQGSELMVLQGASECLRRIRYVKTEVADFEAYAGCCQLPEVQTFMGERGFRVSSKREFARREEGGSYFDVVFSRRS